MLMAYQSECLLNIRRTIPASAFGNTPALNMDSGSHGSSKFLRLHSKNLSPPYSVPTHSYLKDPNYGRYNSTINNSVQKQTQHSNSWGTQD